MMSLLMVAMVANMCGVAIQENIGELRAKRKGVDLFHVNFKEL